MAIVGYCHDCGAWVHVTDGWACPEGHAAARVNGWYDATTGVSVVPVADESGAVTARPAGPAPGTRAGLLTDLMGTIAGDHGYVAEWGSDTDLVVSSNPVDARWGSGSKRAEYSAALKVAEAERTVYFWEVLKERGRGLSFGAVESGSYSISGTDRTETSKGAAFGPGTNSWDWGYGTLRKVVEEVAARHGFTVRVVLARRSAIW